MNRKQKELIKQKQNLKKKNIMLYLSSFIFLAISCVLFIFAFYYERQIKYYICTVLFFVIFCTWYYISGKKISCEDGYNLIQAYLFYKRCEKKGLSTPPDKIYNKQVEFIRDLAMTYDYSKDFDDKKSKKLYETGYDVSTILDKKRR